MAREYAGDLYDFENMSDSEIREVVLDHLREDSNLDAADIDVDVRNGAVTLSGRVGTDSEVQIAENVVDDVLGIDDVNNELVVDELRRDQAPEGADEEVAELEAHEPEGLQARQQSDTAEHINENIAERSFGTESVEAAIRDGVPYSPPDQPTADGYDSRENH